MLSCDCLKRLLSTYFAPRHAPGRMPNHPNDILPNRGTVHVHDHHPETSQGSGRLVLWKERKGLKEVKIPCSLSNALAVLPFSNHVFEEHTKEVTAAIQFCIGNPRKIPFTLDTEFNAALLAEGFRVDDATCILESVFKCAAQGKDLRGNQLQYDKLIPLTEKQGNDISFYGMKKVYLYIDKDWKGVCILMILKETHRLYSNYKNCIMGIVTHGTTMEGAFLLANALKVMDEPEERAKAIRCVVYRFDPHSNSYEREKKKLTEEGIKKVLGNRGFIMTPIGPQRI